MKRRKLVLGSAATLSTAPLAKFNIARAAGTPDPNRLNQDLTPFGAERAGNASGTIPAWTGGVSAPPPGWTKGMIPPDLFANEQPLYTITQDNMAQYADLLCDGQKKLLTEFGSAGFKFKVYPTHRTSAAPQYVYDSMFKNVTSVQPVAEGLLNGFVNAVGGLPFPILSDDPTTAGMQVMWNQAARWGNGPYSKYVSADFVVGNGQVVETSKLLVYFYSPFYVPGTTAEQINNGYFLINRAQYIAPANQVGGDFMTSVSFQPLRYPNTAYEYLVGEGRIREAPQTQYDIPNSFFDAAVNFDEAQVFNGALDRYDWKLVGKKEMLISYNNHSLFTSEPSQIFGTQFIDPEKTRWEVHRVWVVEAHVAQGKRMTMPFRRFYADEDSGCLAQSDSYDDQGNLWRFTNSMFLCDPALPGVSITNFSTYNFESQQYIFSGCLYGDNPNGVDYSPQPASMFQQQALANNGGL